MPKKVLNDPSANVLINSMRMLGHNFKTAVADIVDNSISAHATKIKIYTPINDDLYVAIYDNGEGMSRDELFNAMKYGSNKSSYGEKDLGRYGLGLKSASLSQCKKLTVVSKKEGKWSAFCWDVDLVQESKQWNCLELGISEINMLPKIDILKQSKHGTLVIWQNFDIIYKRSNGLVREALSEEVEETEKHLSLVFHRFINRPLNRLEICINDDKIIGLDPFLEDHPKTDSQKPSIFKCRDSNVKIQPFILPHVNDLSESDIAKLGGNNMLRNGQGFYVYRNERLIIWGTWFRLSSNNLSSELYKYGRIKVDIPNTLDDMWDIDVKKQNATIPKQILVCLKKVVSNVRNGSQDKIGKRANLNFEKNDNKIWNKRLNKDRKEIFFINCDSKFVKSFIDEFKDSDKNKIITFLEAISCSIPYNDIYNSMCNRTLEQKLNNDGFESIVLLGLSQFEYWKKLLQLPNNEIFEKLKDYEPFNNKEILDAVKKRINNER